MTLTYSPIPAAEREPSGNFLLIEPNALELACAVAAARRVSRDIAAESRSDEQLSDVVTIEPVGVKLDVGEDPKGLPEKVETAFVFPDGTQAELTTEQRMRVIAGHAVWGVQTHNRGAKDHVASNQFVLRAWKDQFAQTRESMTPPASAIIEAMQPKLDVDQQVRLMRMDRTEFWITRLAADEIPGAAISEVMINDPRVKAAAVEALVEQYRIVGEAEGHYSESKPFDRFAAHHVALSMIENILAADGKEALVVVSHKRQEGQETASLEYIDSAAQKLTDKISELEGKERRRAVITDDHVAHAKGAEETRALAFAAKAFTAAANRQ